MTNRASNPEDSTSEVLSAIDQVINGVPHERIPAVIAALAAKIGAASARILSATGEQADRVMEENLSAQEAAKRLGVSPDYLYRHARQMPFTVRIGRRLLFSARGLEDWNRKRQGR